MNVIIDLIRKKNEHHVFNFEMIKSFVTLDENTKYILDGDSSSIELIEQKSLIKVNVENSKFYLWVKSNVILLYYVLFHFERNNDNRYIILSATPIQYFICALCSNIFRKKIYIFMHGELAYLIEPIGLGQKIGKWLINASFKIKAKMKYIAINVFIYERLKNLYPSLNLEHIEHPLQSIEGVYNHAGSSDHKKLRIGCFGIQSVSKNSQEIYNLSNKLPNDFWLHAELVTIGVSDGSFVFDLDDRVTHILKGSLKESLIPKEEYMKAIGTLDLILFFNKNNGRYELTPSGVLSDCISLKKPIIAIKTSVLGSYFKRYGGFGVLCSDLDDMAIVLMDILMDRRDLRHVYSNYDHAWSDMSKENRDRKIRSLIND